MVISEKRRDLRRFYICRVIIIGAAANTSRVMLVVLIKSIITFFLVLLVVRLMGKRQLGEMQPFELGKVGGSVDIYTVSVRADGKTSRSLVLACGVDTASEDVLRLEVSKKWDELYHGAYKYITFRRVED